ncbi:MAG: lysophospholipid acyltransferase family protein [Actinomycetota bacterium]
MRWVLAPIRTVLTLVGGVVATLVAAPLVIFIARINSKSPMIEKIIHAWSRAWLLLSGSTLEVDGREHVDPTRSHVVVANHLSQLDIMVCLLAVPLSIRFLAKKELFSIPILAPAMRSVGIIEVDREARSAIHEKVNRQARDLVASGRSLIIYPEGTRSRNGELRPFKKGAFTMAIAGGIPVLPVTISGTYRAWPPGRFWVYGGKIKAVIDPPIETGGLTREDTSWLADEARTMIEKRYLAMGGKEAGRADQS